MNEDGDQAPSTPEHRPQPLDQPVTRKPPSYGTPPVDDKASGRRARLRHPARGGVRR